MTHMYMSMSMIPCPCAVCVWVAAASSELQRASIYTFGGESTERAARPPSTIPILLRNFY